MRGSCQLNLLSWRQNSLHFWAWIVQACVCITIRNSRSFSGLGLRKTGSYELQALKKRNDARGSSACRRTQQGHDLTRSSQKRVQDCLKIHRTICKTLSCRPQYQQRGQSRQAIEPGLYQLELATELPIGCSPLGSSSLLDWNLPINFVCGFLKRFCQWFVEPANSKLL